MADTNTTRRVDHLEFLDNDPFAELTRIMGHDPRAAAGQERDEPAAPEPVADALGDDLDIELDLDLEKELMGDLDFSDFDEPGPDRPGQEQPAAEAAFSRDPADWSPEPPAAMADAQEPAAWDDEPAGWQDDAAGRDPADWSPEPPAAMADAQEPAAWDDEPAEWRDEAAGRDPADWSPEPSAAMADVQEPAAWDDEPAEWQDDASGHEPHAAPEPVAEPVFAASDEPVPDPAGEVDFDFELFEALATEEPVAEAEATAGEHPAAGEPAAQEPFEEAAPPQEAPSHEMPWDLADDRQQPAAVEDRDEPDEPLAAMHAPANEEPPALSLEDELTALLSQDTAPAAAPMSEPEPAYEPEPAVEPAPAASVWHSSADIFGRANFAAGRRDASEAAQPVPEAAHEAEPAASDDDFADMFGTMKLELDSAPEPQPAPAPVAAVPEDAQPPAQHTAPSAEIASPDIATIEIADAAAAVDDDLDIPDVDYGAAPAPRAYDDLESQFEDAFGDFAFDEPVPAAPPHAPAAPVAAMAAAAAGAPAHPAPAQETWQPQQAFAQDDFDYERDLEQAIAVSAYEDEGEAEAPPRRRGLLIAAGVAAIAVIAGAGVFGMSFFGGEADAPALVRADTDPLKVRPENPGGTTVPNQDNEVYQRVQAGESDAAPQQESLITTAEEPLDVAAAEVLPPPLAPGIGDEAGDPAAAPPKAEDRIEPAADEAALGALEDNPVVTPRRVRTMVVRPDGTLVPREEAEPAAAQTQPAEAPLAEPAPATDAPIVAAAPEAAAQNAAEPALDTLPQALPQIGSEQPAGALAAEEDGGPVVDTPPTVAVVPTPRAEAPAARAAVPAAQAPAATPVSAPAAAAPAAAAAAEGAWSMQIASQPTAEGAQATYQDLARRYGSVLQGRGVNIVRADIEGMGTYYRVRIPAATRDDAIQLCTRYKSAGGSCFVSR